MHIVAVGNIEIGGCGLRLLLRPNVSKPIEDTLSGGEPSTPSKFGSLNIKSCSFCWVLHDAATTNHAAADPHDNHELTLRLFAQHHPSYHCDHKHTVRAAIVTTYDLSHNTLPVLVQ